MPQLPVINADGRAAIFTPPRLGPEYFGAGAARSLDEFGQTLLAVGKKLQDQEDELQYASAIGRLDAGLDTIRLDLKQDPDYASHPKKFQQQATALQANIAKELTRQPVQTAFAARAAKTLPLHGVQVQADALSLWNSAQIAHINALRPDYLARAAEAPTDADSATATGEYQAILTQAGERHVLNPVEAEAARQSFVTDVVMARAKREIDQDPAAFDPKKYSGLIKPETLVTLETHALNLTDTRLRARLAEEHRITTLLEKEHKDAYEMTVSDLMAQARDGTLSVPGLETARTTWRMKEEDYTKLRNAIEKPAKEAASDPATLRQFEVAVRSATPKVSKGELAAAYMRGDLNTVDYDRLDTTLTGNLRHLEALRDQGKGEIQAAQAQAEQQLRVALQTTSPLETLNQEAQQVYSVALDELTRRSVRFGGSEAPLAVYREILPKYQAQLGQSVEARVAVKRRGLLYPSVPALQQAYQGKPQDQAFFDTLRSLREIDELERAMLRMTPSGRKATEDFGREKK